MGDRGVAISLPLIECRWLPGGGKKSPAAAQRLQAEGARSLFASQLWLEKAGVVFRHSSQAIASTGDCSQKLTLWKAGCPEPSASLHRAAVIRAPRRAPDAVLRCGLRGNCVKSSLAPEGLQLAFHTLPGF